LLVQYSIDEKNTLRGMVAEYDGYGGDIYHFGFDHQYNDSLMFWGEYYYEDNEYVIGDDNDPRDSIKANGGDVFTVGVRYDFASN